MNSYQKLKQKNEKLRQEYSDLFIKFAKYIENPDTYENIQVAQEILMKHSYNKIVMFGQRNYSTLGLLDAISKEPQESTFVWPITQRDVDNVFKKLDEND